MQTRENDVDLTVVAETKAAMLDVRTLLLGERLDTRGLERRDSLATAPFALRLADEGVAVLFRYGVVVLFNAQPRTERDLLERLAPFVVDPVHAPEIDEVKVQISASAQEPVDPSGTIFLREATTVRLQLVADVLAKSLILSHYETRIAGIFDRVEPLATALRTKGRAAAYGRDLLRQIGGVLEMQQKMVGRVEISEKPELLWEHPELERARSPAGGGI